MRTLLVVVLAAGLVGCGKKATDDTNRAPQAPAKEKFGGPAVPANSADDTAPPPVSGAHALGEKGGTAFDANDIESTARWVVKGLNKSRRFPPGNGLAAKQAVDEYDADLKQMTGQPIRWKVRTGGTDARGRVSVDEYRFRYAGNGPEREYTIRFRWGLAMDDNSRHLFPPKGGDWLTDLQRNEYILLTGSAYGIDHQGRDLGDEPNAEFARFRWDLLFDQAEVLPAR